MSRSRTAVALALLGAALAAAGCGLGPGERLGESELAITRDYGAEALREPVRDEVGESDTVMRLLDRSAEITTRYGGGFVQSIEGLEAGRGDGRSWDWFFYVNGVESPIGAAEFSLRGGERVWWDYRDWSHAMRVPAVVGSWPQPFADGFEGRARSTAVVCRAAAAACGAVRRRLAEAGATLSADAERSIRVLVGPWPRLRGDPAAAMLEQGPQTSGVFADPLPSVAIPRLLALDEAGRIAQPLGAESGLVAATRRFEAPPTWLVTGVDEAGVLAATRLLNAASLRDHYAVATAAGELIPLPLRR